MCDKAVDDCLAALKFVPDWLVTSNMIKKLSTALYADENILYFNEDSGNVAFSSNEMDILNVDLNNINLDDTSNMIKKRSTALYADENILYFNEDSGNVAFSSNEMDILNVDLNNINLDDTNYEEDDPDTIILIRLFFEKRKEL